MKIFGIGMPKTGQTTLTKALNILGYNAIKCPIGYVNNDLSLKYEIIDRFDAVTDTPLTMKYEELHKKYPEAKYVLLYRNIKTWLDSCSCWFDYDNMKAVVDYHALHKSIFGSEYYDVELFKNAFMTYYIKLFAYFQNNDSSYMIFDACSGDSWHKLCGFLDVPMPPDIRFPHENKRGQKNG